MKLYTYNQICVYTDYDYVAGQDQASEVGPEAARHGAVHRASGESWGSHGIIIG